MAHLLRCSGRNTGDMLILLKCSMARVEVQVNMAYESLVLAQYPFFLVNVSLVSGVFGSWKVVLNTSALSADVDEVVYLRSILQFVFWRDVTVGCNVSVGRRGDFCCVVGCVHLLGGFLFNGVNSSPDTGHGRCPPEGRDIE